MGDAEVVGLARRQHGLITRQQAMALGVSRRGIQFRVDTGRWSMAFRGVYAVGGAPPTWHQRLLAACLAAGDDVVVSHLSALRLWGIVGASGRPEILVDSVRRVKLPGVRTHESILLPAMDRTALHGIPVTTLSRTLIDASARQDPKSVGAWIDDGVRRLGLDLADLRSCLARLSGPGRRNVRAMHDALSVRLPGYDPGQSELEGRVVRALLRRELPAPVQQHRVVRPDGSVAYLDVAYPEVLVGMEADGWAYHGTRAAFAPDRSRANDLTLMGWELYRFTNEMDDDDFARTIELAYYRRLATRPFPSIDNTQG